MARRQFLVIGLGRFGAAVAVTLAELGHEVLAVDRDEERVEEVMGLVTQAAVVDATDERALRALGLEHFDAVVVAMSASLEGSVHATLAAREAGARQVVCKAPDAITRRILEKVGANLVVQPEHDSGLELARRLASPHLIGELVLTGELSLIELEADRRLTGTLGSLDLPQRQGVQVVAHVRGETVRTAPGPETEVRRGDRLVLVGRRASLEKLRRSLDG